jgi:hypothetical protein
MFSLIITIISIALVAALAVATIYYGGSAFTQGTAKANASAYVAAGQQINGALALYANDNGGARATLAQLSPSYLAAAPVVVGEEFTVNSGDITAPVASAAVCLAIAQSAGSLAGTATTPLATADADAPYTCAGTTTGSVFSGTFSFKG